jgi:hypothetical protein
VSWLLRRTPTSSACSPRTPDPAGRRPDGLTAHPSSDGPRCSPPTPLERRASPGFRKGKGLQRGTHPCGHTGRTIGRRERIADGGETRALHVQPLRRLGVLGRPTRVVVRSDIRNEPTMSFTRFLLLQSPRHQWLVDTTSTWSSVPAWHRSAFSSQPWRVCGGARQISCPVAPSVATQRRSPPAANPLPHWGTGIRVTRPRGFEPLTFGSVVGSSKPKSDIPTRQELGRNAELARLQRAPHTSGKPPRSPTDARYRRKASARSTLPQITADRPDQA